MQDTIYVAIENSKSSFYGISTDTIFATIFPTIITISIFIIGFLINRYYENQKRRNNLKDIKSFFIIYIESLTDPFEHFIDQLKKLSENIKDLNNRELAFSESSKLAVDENIIDQIDLFKTFVFDEKTNKDEKILYLKNVLNALITIRKAKENLKETFFKFLDDLRRYEDKLKESWNFILRQFDLYRSYGLRNPEALKKDIFLNGLKDIIIEWNNNENKNNIDFTKEKLIDPVEDYCTKNIEDERALHLIPAAVNYNDAYLNIVNLREIYTKVFSDAKDDLNSEKEKIVEGLSFLKK